MNALLCATINGPTFSQAKQQILDSLPFVDSIELRVDSLSTLSPSALSFLLAMAKAPILTYKKPQGLSSSAWVEKILSLAALSPTYLDVDIQFPQDALRKIRLSYPDIKIILSHHTETYEDPHHIYHKMHSTPAHYYKIVTYSETPLQTLRFVHAARSLPPQATALCLGEHSLASRVLSPLMGNAMNYAAGRHASPAAPGQPHLDDLLAYNYKNLSQEAKIYALIGNPVDRSPSHITHNKFFSKLLIKASYIKIPLSPEQLTEFFIILRTLPFRGLSVTMPLKVPVMDYMDILDPSAQLCGAVNTILFHEDVLYGYNTDGQGAFNLLVRKGVAIKNKHVAILGAGGAARSLAVTLAHHGAYIHIFNRTFQNAESLAKLCNGTAHPLKDLRGFASDLLINTLPPEIGFPWEFPPIILDINTFPKNTPYLLKAQQLGVRVFHGYDMFIEQALLQFSLWFPELSSQHLQLFRENVESLMHALDP